MELQFELVNNHGKRGTEFLGYFQSRLLLRYTVTKLTAIAGGWDIKAVRNENVSKRYKERAEKAWIKKIADEYKMDVLFISFSS